MKTITTGFPVELEQDGDIILLKDESTPVDLRIIALNPTEGDYPYDIYIQADAYFSGDLEPYLLKNVVVGVDFVEVEDAADDIFGNGGNYAVIHLRGAIV